MTSVTAEIRTFISLAPSVEKTMPVSCSSCAHSATLSAWSEIRSKSFIVCRYLPTGTNILEKSKLICYVKYTFDPEKEEDEVDVEKNKQLLKEIQSKFKACTKDQKEKIKELLKENNANKFNVEVLPTRVFEETLEILG